MSVVAWDGKTIAADRQATNGSRKFTQSKLLRVESGEIIAWTGMTENGLTMARWYKDGADPAKFPFDVQTKEDWSRLIVASASGVVVYERLPEPQEVEDSFDAWGSGADFAIGALAMGADACQAVAVASRFDAFCGFGVESFTLRAEAA